MPVNVDRARRASFVAFIAAGFAFASWASRIPQVRDRLHVTPAELGLILLAMALGSLVALPLAGSIIHRIGAAHTVELMALLLAVGMAIIAVGYRIGAAVVVVGLVLLGFGNGAWDVAMNVHAADVEKLVGRSIMPRFHAGFSVGTVAGASIGAAMVALHVPVTGHLLGVAIVTAAVVPVYARHFLPEPAHDEPTLEQPKRRAVDAWREPRTLLIGVFVLCAAFTEGTGNDWLGVAVIDGYHSSAVMGTLVFSVFLAAMTTARWFGPGLIDRHGRVPVLRSSVAVAFAGLVLVVVGAHLVLAFVGTVLWGAGAALGFPVGMSAASDESRYAAGRVSVVASIGYTAFLAGPPVIGFLGDRVGVLHALTIAAALLALATGLASATRELKPAAATVRD
ncbi:MAG: MFS transporter [Jatrophihabitantaceae bacterium]